VSVSRARHATREYAERAGADPESVATAVSEAVGNSIIHGYRDGRRGTIRVEARLTGARLSVIVRDFGVGMSPNPRANGLGVGLRLIGRVSDHVEIESHTEGGTRVAMWFRVVGIDERRLSPTGASTGT
jgi:stage II sporulation protein AB (anti-sigma F factor)